MFCQLSFKLKRVLFRHWIQTPDEYQRLMGVMHINNETFHELGYFHYGPFKPDIIFRNTVPVDQLPAEVNWVERGFVTPVMDQVCLWNCNVHLVGVVAQQGSVLGSWSGGGNLPSSNPTRCFLFRRVLSLSKIFAPTGSGQLNLPSLQGLDKSSTRFGWGLWLGRGLCRVAGKTVCSHITCEFS